ncbi:DinB family protein [Tautonia plasticadhaerens]|uniref:DinB superfamily protein n=1 Tax=Tautonia plasticadhaerens TaxID=2527974 RepID=A0A518H6F3_9BACT|nr:DinB family protein [Tautonia plasticadhaerens]QDV36410.1 DinB superfamily protein [Tautonia plasticadhaerens]
MDDGSDRMSMLGDEFIAEARRQLDASAGTIRHCLAQLDDGQVWWRPREGMNSVGNLLLHLAGNLGQRFGSVIGGEPDDRDRLGEFTERGPIPKEDLIRRFEEAVGRADGVLAGLSADRLGETRRYGLLAGAVERPVLTIVLQTLTHLGGHTQEIVQLTRQQLGERYAYMQPAGVPPRPDPKS